VSASRIAVNGAPDITISTGSVITNALAFTILPGISSRSIVNAASWLPAIAPGSLISIWGTGLSTGRAAPSSASAPANLTGTSVSIDGRPGPLLKVTPYQIVAQVPFESSVGRQPAIGTRALAVQVNGAASAQATFEVIPVGPGVMTMPLDLRHALAQNYPDGSLNSPENPVDTGGIVTIYLTGQGLLDNALPNGVVTPATPISRPLAQVEAQVGGKRSDVLFAGMTPELVGVMQVSLVIPEVAAGEQPLEVRIGDTPANTTVLSIHAKAK